jgi:hypothetical protein
MEESTDNGIYGCHEYTLWFVFGLLVMCDQATTKETIFLVKKTTLAILRIST